MDKLSIHFSGDNPVFRTSVRSRRKFVTPCSMLVLAFVNLMCTMAAGAAEMNSATAKATGKSTPKACKLVNIGSCVVPMKLVSSRNTIIAITLDTTEDFVGTHVHQRCFGLHAMGQIDEHHREHGRKNVSIQSVYLRYCDMSAACADSTLDAIYCEQNVKAQGHHDHDDDESFQQHSQAFSSCFYT